MSAKAASYQALKESIQEILLRYFQANDAGEPSPLFDEDCTAQQVIDDIHDLIGEI